MPALVLDSQLLIVAFESWDLVTMRLNLKIFLGHLLLGETFKFMIFN